MRAVVQRVARAAVVVDQEEVGAIGPGLCVLLSVAPDDDEQIARHLAGRIATLRILADGQGKMNLDVGATGGAVLVVSQFTLHAGTSRGHRPSFMGAAPPELAERLYLRFAEALRVLGVPVATGRFGAVMAVELVNDGPFTIWLDTADH